MDGVAFWTPLFVGAGTIATLTQPQLFSKIRKIKSKATFLYPNVIHQLTNVIHVVQR